MALIKFRHIYQKHLIEDGIIANLDDYPVLDAPHTDIYDGECNNKQIALKRWRLSKPSEAQLKRTLMTFVARLDDWKSVSDHPNILPFIGLSEGCGRVPDLIMPRMKCNILQYTTENPSADKLVLVHQISEALVHLHSQRPPIVHGGIKETNILITEDCRVRVTDIGIYATFLNPEMSQDWRPSERPRFQSPEQLMQGDDCPLQPSCDIWSFAMVVLQIFTGILPYAHLANPNTAIIQIAQGTHPPKPAEQVVSSELWKLLVTCWNFDPRCRPHMRCLSPWVRLLREQERIVQR